MRVEAIRKLFHSAMAGWHRVRSAILQDRSLRHAGKAREHDWRCGVDDDEPTETGVGRERKFRPF